MSNYGFGKKAFKTGSGLDLSALPKSLPPLDPVDEREAIKRGEALGFIDRGQGNRPLRRRKAVETANLFIKGPVEIVEWLINYTDEQGHSAYWKSIEDFRNMIEKRGG